MTMSLKPLTLAEAQAIAESVIGAVEWRGPEGHCRCPGEIAHTTRTDATHCKVVVGTVPKDGGELKPGVYCFHASCKSQCDAASFRLRSALGKRSPSPARAQRKFCMPTFRPKPKFDPCALAKIAAKLNGVGVDWLAERSPIPVDTITPASFLNILYEPGERVVVFDVFESQGQYVWMCKRSPLDERELDSFRSGKKQGVWFLTNPVDGRFRQNDRGQSSRRSKQNITSWRYMVLESDVAETSQWLSALVQMPLPIAAIYTSGGRSIHALVRVNASSKSHWDSLRDAMKHDLITLGADEGALSAVRLSRLPGCERVETRQMQRLLYLNGEPSLMPIVKMPITTRYADWKSAEKEAIDGKVVA